MPMSLGYSFTEKLFLQSNKMSITKTKLKQSVFSGLKTVLSCYQLLKPLNLKFFLHITVKLCMFLNVYFMFTSVIITIKFICPKRESCTSHVKKQVAIARYFPTTATHCRRS